MKVTDGGITSPKGFEASGVHCGLKSSNPDLALIHAVEPASVSMVFTQNKVKAANVRILMDRDPDQLSAFVINSGNANALTGERGVKDALQMGKIAAEALGIGEHQVAMASTGIIGKFLPMEKIESGIMKSSRELGSGRKHDTLAAQAILTTDNTIKEAACRVTLEDGTEVTVGGMAKGSGMISPSMRGLHATTLSFITTDAVLSSEVDDRWQSVIDSSFNMINVDGDQSTNDLSALMANGAAGGSPADQDPNFWGGVKEVSQILAKKVARDGEGATKLIEVRVQGASTKEDARKAARSVICSNLVKAAMFGADPNYGRIMAAIGSSGAEMIVEETSLSMGSGEEVLDILEDGEPLIAVGKEGKKALKEIMKRDTVFITIDLGIGNDSAVAWGCDLTYDYVRINAEYTT